MIPFLSIATGCLKVMVAVNNVILKSDAIAKLLFFISVPGFGLVVYSHIALDLPMAENVGPIMLPILLGIIAFTSPSSSSTKVE